MVDQLPRHSATNRKRLGPEALWTDAEYLTAMVVDSQRIANYYLAGMAGVKNPDKPQPVTRPKDAFGQFDRAAEMHRRLVEFRERRARELAQG